MLKHLDLCSGIGGFALGFEWAGLSKPVLFCDIEPWSRKILAKHWPDVPIAEDVKELANDPDGLIPDCDILTAGYPCQPFSLAGERRGTEDDRHIWPFILTIVQAKRPSWCVFENVYGHVSMGLDEVLSDLESEGYTARPFVIPACAVDAPHRRDRVWIIAAHADSESEPDGTEHEQRLERANNVGDTERQQWGAAEARRLDVDGSLLDRSQWREKTDKAKGSGADVPNADSQRLQRQSKPKGSRQKGRQQASDEGLPWGKSKLWQPEPAVGRVANGIPKRVDRLRGLGNAIVPQIAMQIGLTIKNSDKQEGLTDDNVQYYAS